MTILYLTLILLLLCVWCSYRENASLGDPNSLVEELLQIRNKVRIKEADLAMIKGKVRIQIIVTVFGKRDKMLKAVVSLQSLLCYIGNALAG